MWGEQGREDWSGKKWESKLSMTRAHIKLSLKTEKQQQKQQIRWEEDGV